MTDGSGLPEERFPVIIYTLAHNRAPKSSARHEILTGFCFEDTEVIRILNGVDEKISLLVECFGSLCVKALRRKLEFYMVHSVYYIDARLYLLLKHI